MPKYYVQSGSMKMILQAKDSRSAAIWATHRSLSQTLPFLGDELDGQPPTQAANRLGTTIDVSQQGFGGQDRVKYDTLDVVAEWNCLLVALDRLQDRLLQAAANRHREEMTAV